MKIQFTLNGKNVETDTSQDRNLSELLSTEFSIFSVRSGCRNGTCGNCSFFLNGALVLGCLVPVFMARGGEIITFEGFSKTREYEDITQGFQDVSFAPCPYCYSAKVLITEMILETTADPDDRQITESFGRLFCPCTSPPGLVEAVRCAAEYRKRRQRARKR